MLFILDAPICLTTHDELLGALKHETLTLKCEVDASPPAESFHWTFNSSGEQTDLPSRLHSSEVIKFIQFLFSLANICGFCQPNQKQFFFSVFYVAILMHNSNVATPDATSAVSAIKFVLTISQ